MVPVPCLGGQVASKVKVLAGDGDDLGGGDGIPTGNSAPMGSLLASAAASSVRPTMMFCETLAIDARAGRSRSQGFTTRRCVRRYIDRQLTVTRSQTVTGATAVP